MKGLRRHPLRVMVKSSLLAGVILIAFLDYLFRYAFRPGKATPIARAQWTQRHVRRVLKVFQLEPRLAGQVPARGMLISNHLGYLDIFVISKITPAVFVAKKDIKSWPVFGRLAQLGGALFVDRGRRTQVGEANQAIQAALDSGALVVLFPEGTSSDGRGVLPFKSALLEPAMKPSQPLAIGAIEYALDDGDAAQEVCYWGDHTLLPHLLNLLSKRAVHATVRFASFAATGADRKELARQLRAEVLKLKENRAP